MLMSENTKWREDQIRFYTSRAWKDLRAYIIKERGGLCESCLKQGIIKAADVVHHIKPVTAENVNDPEIALNPDNLMALCTECHAAIHSGKRYIIGPDGAVQCR